MIALLALAAAVAAAPIADPIEDACYERDASQQAMNACAGAAYQRADTALNAQWAGVMKIYGDDAEAKTLLLDSQRAWLKYRDGQCQMAAFDSRGGSIWPLMNSLCLAEMTRARTAELKALIEGEAGQ